jgi:hypothetical protein
LSGFAAPAIPSNIENVFSVNQKICKENFYLDYSPVGPVPALQRLAD